MLVAYRTRPNQHPFLLIFLCLFLCFLLSCSSRQAPAPLTILNSQSNKSYATDNTDTYTVVKGDTLFSIAWYTGNDYRDLVKWNQIQSPDLIKVGQTLKIRRPNVNKTPAKTVSKITPPTTSKEQAKSVETANKRAYGETTGTTYNKPATIKNAARQSGFPASVDKWVWPVKGKVIQTFTTSGAVNQGIDIQAPLGTPVVSAADGKVVYTGSALRGYGNLVIVKHTETFLSAYAHNDKIVVKERDWIKAGEQIATLGDSGTHTNKLHFEVRYRGKSLDPMRFLNVTK